jgi:hypothetical protein
MDKVQRTGHPYVILGDFNVPNVSWKSPSEPICVLPNIVSTHLLDEIVSNFNMEQFCLTHTRGNHTLDLCLSNLGKIKVDVGDDILNSDHRSLSVYIQGFNKHHRNIVVPEREIYNYKKANWTHLTADLAVIPWSEFLLNCSIDECTDTFYDLVIAAIKDHVPRIKLRRRVPPWYDAELIKALKLKELRYRTKKRFKTTENYQLFKEARLCFQQMAKSKYLAYVVALGEDVRHDPKRFFAFAATSVKGSKSRIPGVVQFDGREAEDDQSQANLFNSYFKSVFAEDDGAAYPALNTQLTEILRSFSISRLEVKSELESLNVHKAMGGDGLPAVVLKNCADELSIPLTIIFNRSIDEGFFPTIWKRALVVPIHKKGNKADVRNYRPVSLLPIASKICEKLVCKHVFNHVRCVLSEHQHGFVPGRSCETNLATLLREARLAFNGAGQMDVIYTDFSKAFDKVNHRYLVYKLDKYGIQDNLGAWFNSYLVGRSQSVLVKGCNSSTVSVSSGVPQGSQLGPLCFILYINDIFRNFRCNSLGFADDLKLYKRVCTVADCADLQHDIDALALWSDRWKMTLNLSKCVVLRLTLKRVPIISSYKVNSYLLESVSTCKDLGVTLDTKLLFTSHVNSVISESRRTLGMIKRFGKGLPVEALIIVYTTFVRTKLEYASTIWNSIGKVNTDRIEAVQRIFFRYLCHVKKLEYDKHSYQSLCVIFKLSSLSGRRKYFDLLFLFKSVNAYYDCQPFFGLHVPGRSTRQTRTFHEPSGRINFSKNVLFNRIPTLFNQYCLSMRVFNISLSIFKNNVKNVFF